MPKDFVDGKRIAFAIMTGFAIVLLIAVIWTVAKVPFLAQAGPASNPTSSSSSKIATSSTEVTVTGSSTMSITTQPSSTVTTKTTTSSTNPTSTSRSTTRTNIASTSTSSSATSGVMKGTVEVVLPIGVGDNESLNFNPAAIRVVIGVNNTIVWDELDPVQHTIVSLSVPIGAARFDSGILNQGQMFTVTLTVPGTYRYHCSDHPGWMVGTIQVVG